jgi:hypothetical protein
MNILLIIVAFTLDAWQERNAYHLALVGMLAALVFMAVVQALYCWEVYVG